MPLTRIEIASHIADDSNVTWIPAEELLADTMESCVDGRGELGIVGTPGGNAGEFLLALATLERVSGQPFPLDQLEDFFHKYIDRFGKFYMHGDTHALARMPAEIWEQAEPAESQARTMGNFLRNPPTDLQGSLLEELLEPDHIGCGHLRLMLTRPDDYGVRPELTLGFMRVFFNALWQGKSLDYVVLEGNHQEGAVVNITLAGDVQRHTLIPTITPQVGGRQMFVNHPQAAAFLRWELASGIDSLTSFKVDPQTFFQAMGELANQQLGHTLQALAKGLPVFEARFQGVDCQPEVTELMVV